MSTLGGPAKKKTYRESYSGTAPPCCVGLTDDARKLDVARPKTHTKRLRSTLR